MGRKMNLKAQIFLLFDLVFLATSVIFMPCLFGICYMLKQKTLCSICGSWVTFVHFGFTCLPPEKMLFLISPWQPEQSFCELTVIFLHFCFTRWPPENVIFNKCVATRRGILWTHCSHGGYFVRVTTILFQNNQFLVSWQNFWVIKKFTLMKNSVMLIPRMEIQHLCDMPPKVYCSQNWFQEFIKWNNIQWNIQ